MLLRCCDAGIRILHLTNMTDGAYLFVPNSYQNFVTKFRPQNAVKSFLCSTDDLIGALLILAAGICSLS